jgi:DUF1680 family protein
MPLLGRNMANGDALDYVARTFEVVCGSWAGFKLTRYLMTLTGQAGYGEWVETLLYNGIGAALPMRDDAERRGKTSYYHDYRLGGGRKRYHECSFPCCSGTYPQVVGEIHNLIYFRDDDALYVNLFVPSTAEMHLGGRRVRVTQETAWPASETTALRIACDGGARFAVKVRVPAWAEPSAMRSEVNGESVQMGAAPGEWAAVERDWSDGDVLKITVPMRLRFVPIDGGHPRRAALMFGPVMLVAEGRTGGRLRGDIEAPSDWIHSIPGETLHFAASGQPGGEVTFRPFYEFGENEFYTAYHDVGD